MGPSLIPRFYYSFPLGKVLSAVFSGQPAQTEIEAFDGKKPFFHNSGRTGLRLLLSATGKKKLNIGVQAYTCHSVFAAIDKAGHDFVFIDVDDNFQLDLEDLERKSDQIDVLIVTHTFGLPERFNEIRSKLEPDKIIIEDCAHGFGSKYSDGTGLGLKGDAAIFSFGLGKLPPIGNLGCTVINNSSNFPRFEYEYKQLKSVSLSSRLSSFVKRVAIAIAMRAPIYGLITRPLGKRYDSKFDFGNKFGFPESKGSSFGRKVFLKNLDFVQTMISHNRDNAAYLSQNINSDVIINREKTSSGMNAYIFAIKMRNRDDLFRFLLSNNVEPGKHFYQSLEWAKQHGYETGMCPKTEELIESIITLPIHAGVRSKQLYKMAGLIADFEHEEK